MGHGMSGENRRSFIRAPFDVHHLPAVLKLEVVCSEESFENVVKLIAWTARPGNRGDGIIAVHDVEKVLRIREIEPLW
jgi:nitrogen regulatory protein PII